MPDRSPDKPASPGRPPEPLRVDAILFDAGDILYHRPRRMPALARFLAPYRLEPSEIRDAATKAAKQAAWLGDAPRESYYEQLLVAAGLDDRGARAEGVRLLAAAQNDVEFFPGVADTLLALRRAGYRLGIVTNTHETTAEKLAWFARIGIDGVWDAFANSCELGLTKPEPAIYLAALAQLDVAPRDAAFVAHSGKELDGAKRVGMATVSFNPDHPDVAADRAAARFADLPALFSPGPEAAERGRHPRPGPAGLPTIAAHRGGALLWPENSMTAFRGAVRLGADLIETDIHLSSDGVPMLIHDPNLDRTVEATGPVAGCDRAALAALRLRGTEEGVPMLDALLDLIEPTTVDLRLEIKVDAAGRPYPGLSAVVAAALDRRGMLGRTTVSSFEWPTLQDFAALARPSGFIGLARDRSLAALGGVDGAFTALARHGVDELAIPCHRIDRETLAAAGGRRLGAYAVKSADDVARALDSGLTTFTTDIPDLALTERRARLAAINRGRRTAYPAERRGVA